MLIQLLLGLRLSAPTDSTTYTVYNHDRPAGTMVVARWDDSVRVRFIFTDRNRGARFETRYHRVGNLMVGIESRRVLPDGLAGDPIARLELIGDSVRRWSPGKTTMEPAARGVYYGTTTTPYDDLLLIHHLLRRPGRTTSTGPDSTVRLDVVRQLTVPTTHGPERVRLVTLTGNHNRSVGMIWLDSHDDIFATGVSWFMTVQRGAEPALPILRRIEAELRNAAGEALNRQLQRPTSDVLAITNADLFDSERGVIRPHTTILVRGDRIVAVGPADSVVVPAGATRIEATDKTVMPGMWEMHQHLFAESQSSANPLTLARGITTARDLGSDPDIAVANRDREAAGKVAGPRQILSGFIDGPGAWAGPTPNIVRTEAEARAFVAHFDSLGYKQIKLYNLVHPDLVPTFAAEAHKRGMRLSGHVPRGLSVAAAIDLGYDEVNHVAFLFSTFYQDSLYTPTMRAYSLVANIVAPRIDVEGAPMTELIATLARHHTVIDGTFNIWQIAGDRLAESARKANANFLRLIRRLFEAGVTLVAGTDDFGSATYNDELELYQKAGIPAATVLQIATIVPARVMKDDRDYGSVAVGKVADFFVVNGKPTEDVRALRKVEQVVRGGRLYDSRSLQGP